MALLTGWLLNSGSPIAGTVGEVHQVRALREVFEANAEEALKIYEHKDITVEGHVIESGMSVYMTPMVQLSDRADGKIYAACILPRRDFGKLDEYTKGRKVRFSGNCRGLTFNEEWVLIKECREVPPEDKEEKL